ncbi:hypothetical protein E2C01_015696 [Portunus trituberculatus]|uniref:Uncharacterized protein n=1 Tax=Portunus trituberculatus TaxID=210409 RepID=A0A5B7DNB0_PORTR|nr:hypothetical protein [Portunus trituberculatus]
MLLCSFDLGLHLLPDEGVHEAVVNGGTLDGVQHEAALQEILQLGHLAGVIFGQVSVSQHLMLKTFLHCWQTYPLSDFVNIPVEEVTRRVKVLVLEGSFPDDLLEGTEQLVGVGAHSLHMQTHILSILLQHLVWRQKQEQEYSHDLIVPDDLDGHVQAPPRCIPRPHHVTEHSLPCVPIDSVPEGGTLSVKLGFSEVPWWMSPSLSTAKFSPNISENMSFLFKSFSAWFSSFSSSIFSAAFLSLLLSFVSAAALLFSCCFWFSLSSSLLSFLLFSMLLLVLPEPAAASSFLSFSSSSWSSCSLLLLLLLLDDRDWDLGEPDLDMAGVEMAGASAIDLACDGGLGGGQ